MLLQRIRYTTRRFDLREEFLKTLNYAANKTLACLIMYSFNNINIYRNILYNPASILRNETAVIFTIHQRLIDFCTPRVSSASEPGKLYKAHTPKKKGKGKEKKIHAESIETMLKTRSISRESTDNKRSMRMFIALRRENRPIVASPRRETIAIKNQPVANAKMVGARKATGERDRLLYVLPWTLIATIKDFVHVPPVPRTFSRSKCVMSTLWPPLSARFTVTKKNSR